VVEIRRLARRGEAFSGRIEHSEAPFDSNFLARIRMVADTCDEMTSALGEPDAAARERAAARALSWRWTASPPEVRQWMDKELESRFGPEIRQYIPHPYDVVRPT
jgi:hypothetical protein